MPVRLRAALGGAAALAALGLGAALAWRVADVSGRAARGEVGSYERRATSPDAPAGDAQAGTFSGVTFRYFDPTSGRLILTVRAKRGSVSGDSCSLEEVEMERQLGAGRGRFLAAGRTGTYDRATGSARLAGAVTARRFPELAAEPDLTLSSESLAWNNVSGVLSSQERVEVTWKEPGGRRAMTASGLGMEAQRETQRVVFREDVRVSLAGAALPADLELGRVPDPAGRPKPPAGAAGTVITCAGPAVFEPAADAGGQRALFRREVNVRSAALREGGGEARLSSDELEIWLREPGRADERESPGLVALAAASAAPAVGAATTRWALAATAPRPAPAGAKAGGDASRVDLAVARGAVSISARDGIARGHLAWYDGAAGSLWLEGRGEERAEVVRGRESQTLARRFWYDVQTGEMGVPEGDRVTVTVEP